MDLIVNDCSFSTLFTLCFCNCLLHSTISVRSVSPYTTLHYSTAHCSVEGTISIIACVVAWLPRQATYGWSAVPDRWNDWNLITASSCTPVLLADGSRHRAVPHTPARCPDAMSGGADLERSMSCMQDYQPLCRRHLVSQRVSLLLVGRRIRQGCP